MDLRFDMSAPKAAWMERFWASKEQRRAQGAVYFEFGPTHLVCRQAGVGDTAEAAETGEKADAAGGGAAAVAAAAAQGTAWRDQWTKRVEMALRKVDEEDLGAMDAAELKQAVCEGGDGGADLAALETSLSVLVFFDTATAHVWLVGARKKLDKKCAEIRNLLSHYHWRMSGKDVSFDAMVARNGKST